MSENNFESAMTYTSYLAVDELLNLQRPVSVGPEHDEMLLIIIHQTYELWFKQLIHEFAQAQRSMESGDTHYSLSVLGRIRTIMKICVNQIDILETMTPLQFNSFRSYLSSSSGFQSAQFSPIIKRSLPTKLSSSSLPGATSQPKWELKRILSGKRMKCCRNFFEFMDW